MNIAYSKTREQFPLSYKKIIKKTISGTILIIILAMIIVAFLAYVGLELGQINPSAEDIISQDVVGWLVPAVSGTLGFLFVFIVIIYFYQRWYFAVYFYDLTPDFIQIKKGPITPREITIPWERIQDVYVDQDLLDRIFGLYDVHLSSATVSSGSEAHIDGVEKHAAEGLRNILLETVKQRISKGRGANVLKDSPTL